ncbi:hypothetical protein Ae168Ps1_6430 [Pseudonocardia sp. Ae168_Ps1]|nr:hypothetical protein Ae168Ps1_6430 [Pseudonocardia sp. Ae168_Ps1]OLL70005.1 hypothetical protein Ae263Ps1_6397 [Pseudonocardia sp. Ae263_Ps1]OLL89003.1 hypothetical protein Ae356Ps1_6330c [Pseudonocardia sp. Ae356_Ps1]OLM08390.1 hypothetical protein Ae505Ps2_6096c [Pseudonocardia sp. Ae505_Ps2]
MGPVSGKAASKAASAASAEKKSPTRGRRTSGSTREAAPGRPVSRGPERPELVIESPAGSLQWLTASMGAGPLSGVFRRGNDVVHTPRVGEDGHVPPRDPDDDDGPAQVRRVTARQVAALVDQTHSCREIRYTKDGAPREVDTLFPLDAAQRAVDSLDYMRSLRPLRGVTHVPTPRRDGTIIDQPGYDPETRLIFLPPDGLTVPPVPQEPTDTDVRAAVTLLSDMLADFAFKSEADHANYVGMLLTPLLREICPPPYKLAAIGAPSPGSGKSLLCDIIRTLHGGVFRADTPADSEEWRKSITTILDTTTAPVVEFDNVSGTLKSPVLAGLLTSPVWSDRRLGATETVTAKNDRTWVVTGNNMSLGGDLVRRTVQITIDPGVPHPEKRNDFTIKDLKGWVGQRRGALIGALLTLIRAWVVAGRPLRRKAGADSYRAWIETVDGILGHAGISGTFDGADSQRITVGDDDEEWRDFLEAVHCQFGERAWTVKELLALVSEDHHVGTGEFDQANAARRPIPLDALPAELGEKVVRGRLGVGVIAKSLGRWLTNREGRWAGEKITVRRAGRTRDKIGMWRIEHLGETEGYPVPVKAAVGGPEPLTTAARTAAPEPSPAQTPAESGAGCVACQVPGPACGFGVVLDEGQEEPCVLCGHPTLIRSRCGTARHATPDGCPRGDRDRTPTPSTPPEQDPADDGQVPTPPAQPEPPAAKSGPRRGSSARAFAQKRRQEQAARLTADTAALADGSPLRVLRALEEEFAPHRKDAEGRLRRPFWRPPLPGITWAAHVISSWAWERPFVGEVVSLDRSGAFVAAASSVLVAHGGLEHTGECEFDAQRAGYWQVQVHPWTERDELPHPLAGHGKATELWVPTPTAALLRDLAEEGRWADLTVLDSYTAAGVRLSDWTGYVNALRKEAITTYGRDSDQYAAVKTAFGQALSLMLGTPTSGDAREWRAAAQRPDWTHAIQAQASATLWRWADDCRKLAPELAPVALANVDELVIPADALEVVTSTPRPGGRAPLQIDPDGVALGSFKAKARETRET